MGKKKRASGKSKRRRWWALLLGVPLLLLAFAWFQASRLQQRALRLAQTGKAASGLLSGYSAAIKAGDRDALIELYDPAYHHPSQGFWKQRKLKSFYGVEVLDWFEGPTQVFDRNTMAEQLARFRENLAAVHMSKFKLAEVEAIEDDRGAVIRAVLWLRGRTAGDRTFESQTHFRLRIRKAESGDWRITRQDFLRGQTVTGSGSGFQDVAATAGLDYQASINPVFTDPSQKPMLYEIARYASGAVSTADIDNDGWYDLLFVGGERAGLFLNKGDGKFRDATSASGLSDLSGFNVGIFGDFDGDGLQDLFAGSYLGSNRIFRNAGDGRFEEQPLASALARGVVATAAAADYDNDGDLDLYLGRYLDPRHKLPTTLFYTRNSEGNSLLRNDGGFQFTDVTDAAGVAEGGLTLGLAWADYDRDGHQDLYVANDFGRNALLRNRGDGSFEDVSLAAGALDIGYGMSATFGDIDNDADLDIYVANVHSGQRWYGQATMLHSYILNSLMQGTLFDDWPIYREIHALLGSEWSSAGPRIIKGNSLLINDGNGNFVDRSEDAGSNPFGWYWGSAMLDYDNDGYQDIYAANGFVTGKTTDDL